MEWITTILLTLAASVISLSTDCLSLVLELNVKFLQYFRKICINNK